MCEAEERQPQRREGRRGSISQIRRGDKDSLLFAKALWLVTGSRRRAAQLLARRPDLRILDIRGNVDTRVRKTLDPARPYDAVVLAAAGLKRLGLDAHISLTLPF